jgi:uncharacterized membrane protein
MIDQLIESSRMVHSYLGLFHTLVALLAMLFGAIVLLRPKGTRRHKQLGYAYVICMVLLNGSAFGIYNFGGKPSLFHLFALISFATLLAGIIPAIRKSSKKWYQKHFYFMSWSVVGLYCAFWAETGTRLLDGRNFWWVVMIASMATAFVGMIIIKRKAKSLFINP